MAEDNTPTNVVDDIPDNIQKLIDEGKVIQTKTSSFAFDEANQNTLVIDKSTVTSKEYKELKKFADEFEYMLIKPYKVTNQSTGVKTNNFDLMKSEYFNTYNAQLEKLVPGNGYSLAIYTPHQDQVQNLLSNIYNEYSQYFDKRFELEMYPYKGTEFTDGKSVLLLKKIYIKPEFQGQGIGSEIINKVTNFADELNIPVMLSTDPATKLSETLPDYYARFGFLDTGDVEAHTGNRERMLIRQPGELAGKIVEYGELADDFKTYEEALQAARNTDKPLYPDYIIKQITDRGQTVPGLDTPTNVVDDKPDNIQKLIDEGKVIQTKTGNSTFKTLNRPTLLIDDKNISTNTYKELMNFADKNNYTLVVALERITEDSGYVTSELGPMNKDELYKFWTRNGNEYFNWDLTYDNKKGIEKLWNDDKYVLEFYEPNQQAVKKFQDEIRNKYPELEQNRKAFTLEMYPYKTYDTNGNPVLMLREINVKPEFQGKGIGTQIMNELIEFADNLNIPILLSTSPTGKETLPEFYNRFGFIETGETGSNFENEKFMIRQPNELAGKVGRIGEVGGTEYKSYEEALEAVKNTDTPGGSLGAAKINDPLVFDSWIDNYAKTTTSFVDNLPLSTTVKNQFNNLLQGKARNLATPGGIADAVDVWELGVLGLMIAAVAYKEYDEIPTILTNKAIDMFNSMTSSYGIPPVPKEEYDLDYEFINKVVETGEKFMPTDIIIKKVGDVVKGAAETGAVTGFGYVPPNLTKTDTMETTQKIQPGVQEEKMFEQAKPKKIKPTGGAGAKIL